MEEDSNQARKSDPYVLHRRVNKKDNKRVEKSKSLKTIRDKDICLNRDIETWVVLSFVSPNPIVSLAETETAPFTDVPPCPICVSFGLLYTS